MSETEIRKLAQDNLTIEIRTVDRAGNVLDSRAFSGAGDTNVEGFHFSEVERCGSYANAEVAATEYENVQRGTSAFGSFGWIVDRIYS